MMEIWRRMLGRKPPEPSNRGGQSKEEGNTRGKRGEKTEEGKKEIGGGANEKRGGNTKKEEEERPSLESERYAQLAKDDPTKSMQDINKIIGQQWKLLNDEHKMQYKEQGLSMFQQKTETWNRASQALAHSNRDSLDGCHSFAFTRMS